MEKRGERLRKLEVVRKCTEMYRKVEKVGEGWRSLEKGGES